jgi:hypothetical protein
MQAQHCKIDTAAAFWAVVSVERRDSLVLFVFLKVAWCGDVDSRELLCTEASSTVHGASLHGFQTIF